MSDEPSLQDLLLPRFRGALVGGAIGDALGFPFEGSTRNLMLAVGSGVTQRFERHRSGYYPPGQYSDDTQMTLATVDAILEVEGVEGRVVADHFVPLWRENRIIGRGSACSEAIGRLMRGEADWESSGAPEGRAGNGAAMRATPLGLWHYDDPAALLEDIEVVSAITHQDRRAIAGAAAVATAIAYCVTHRDVILGEFLDDVAKAAAHFHEDLAAYLRDLPRILSFQEEDALRHFSTLGLETPYRENHDGITPFVIPTVLVAFYYFLRSPEHFERTVGSCLQAGGDVDTVASIAGALSGAQNGDEGIPKHLREGVLHTGQISKLAEEFYEVKQRQRRR